ncbi:MAG: hypothetical protein HYY09_05650 [Firmicutes bacterium]|nr:hypothetical protein [Bacillota bacterium]
MIPGSALPTTRAFRFAASVLIIILFAVFTASCGRTPSPDRLRRLVRDSVSGIKDYRAAASVTRYGVHSSQTYQLRQLFKQPDRLRIEVESVQTNRQQIFLWRGGRGWVAEPRLNQLFTFGSPGEDPAAPGSMPPGVGSLPGGIPAEPLPAGAGSVSGDPDPALVFLGALAGILGEGEIKVIAPETVGITRALLVEVPAPGGGFTARLWLNEKGWLPVQVEMLDPKGRVLERTVYSELDLNVGLDDSLFQPE